MRLAKLLLIGVLCLSLLLSPHSGWAVEASEPVAESSDQSQTPASSPPVNRLAQQSRREAALPAFNAHIVQTTPARVGGFGVAKINIIRQHSFRAKPRVARFLQTQVVVNRQTRLGAVNGRKWRCKVRAHVASCRYLLRLLPSQKPAPLFAVTRVPVVNNAKLGRHLKGIKSRSTWQERTLRKRWVRSGVSGSGAVTVEPRLLLGLSSANGPRILLRTAGTPARLRTIALKAVVRNGNDKPVVGVWKQLRGPRVAWHLNGALPSGKPRPMKLEKTGTIGVIIPRSVKRPTRFVFQLRAASLGGSVTRTVAIRVAPQRTGVFAPRTNLSVNNLLNAGRRAFPKLTSGQKVVSRNSGTLSGPRIIRADPRQSISTAFQPPSGATVQSVAWRQIAGPEGLLDGAIESANGITLRAPAQPFSAAILGAVATLADGRIVHRVKMIRTGASPGAVPTRGETRESPTDLRGRAANEANGARELFSAAVSAIASVLRPRSQSQQLSGSASPTPSDTSQPEPSATAPSAPQSPSQQPSPGKPTPDNSGSPAPAPPPTTPPAKPEPSRPKVQAVPDPDDANAVAFCELVVGLTSGDQSVEMELATSLGLPAATSSIPDDCTAPTASISFTGASLAFAGNTFVNVKGTMTKDRLTLSDGDMQLPQAWRTVAPNLSVLPATATTPILATSVDGSWGAPAGVFTVKPLTIAGQPTDGIPFLPQPKGWSFDKDGFTLELAETSIPAPVPDDPAVDVAMLQVSESASGPASQGSGVALFSVGIVDGAASQISVAVGGIAAFATTDGGQLLASGSGTIDVANRTGSVTAGVTCDNSANGDSCQISKNFALTAAEVSWSNMDDSAEIALSVDGAVRAGEQFYAISGEGNFVSSSEWSVSVASDSDIPLSESVTMSDIAGTVGMKPGATDPSTGQPGSAALMVNLQGSVTGFEMDGAVTVSGVTARITNMCAESGSAKCNEGEVRIDVNVSGAMQLRTGPAPFNATASINLTTMVWGVSANLTGVQFGPTAIGISGIGFTVTNSTSLGACRAKNSPAPAPPPPTTYSLAISAVGYAFDQTLNFAGQLSSDRNYCVYAQSASMEAGRGAKVDSATLAYSSYPTGATLSVPTNGGTQQINIKPKQFSLSGSYTLESDIATQLDNPGDPQLGNTIGIQATMNADLSGFSANIVYTLGSPIYLVGDENSNNLTMNTVSLGIEAGSDGIGLTFAIGVNYHTMPGPDPSLVPASDTPMFGSIAVKFTPAPELTLAVGVDVTNGPVQNAFGQTGLTIKALAVAATIAASPSFSFAGSATFPTEWVDWLQLRDGATVSIGFSLSETSPCIGFQINGRPTSTGYETAFDLLGMGFMTASLMKLVIAPTGCDLTTGPGQSYVMNSGISLQFDGEILSAPVSVGFNIKLPTPSSPGLVVQANLKLPELAIPGVTMGGYPNPEDGVLIDIDIDTQAQRYYVKISAGIQIGIGSKDLLQAGVYAYLNWDPSTKTFVFKFQGESEINLFVAKSSVFVAFDVEVVKGQMQTFGITGNFDVKVIGQEFYGGASLMYSGKKLMIFRVYGGISVNIIVGAFSGTFDINYCTGSLTKPESGVADCTLNYDDKSNTEFLIRMYGSIRILFARFSYDWTLVDKMTTPDGDDVDSNVPYTQYLDIDAEHFIRNRSAFGSMGGNGTSAYVARLQGYPSGPIGGMPPCTGSKVSTTWEPTAEEPNPPNTPDVIPLPEGGCVVNTYFDSRSPSTDPRFDDPNHWGTPNILVMLCDAQGCRSGMGGSWGGYFYQNDVYNGSNADTSEAARKLAMSNLFTAGILPTPPNGQLPTGWMINQYQAGGQRLVSPAGTKAFMWSNQNRGTVAVQSNDHIPVVNWHYDSDASVGQVRMQSDGNLVGYPNASATNAKFSSGTDGTGSQNFARLVENGDLTVRTRSGGELWRAEQGSPNGAGMSADTSNNVIMWSNTCLDGGAGGTSQALACNGSVSQNWTLADTGIVNASTGKCLAVRIPSADSDSGNTWANGTPVEMQNCNGADNQDWLLIGGSYYNPTAARCLNINGSNAELRDCASAVTFSVVKNRGSTLRANESMYTDQALVGGKYQLTLQSDNNLVVYNRASSQAVWSQFAHPSKGAPKDPAVGAYRYLMQSDGNFCAYDANGSARWCSGTDGTGADRIVMQLDGNLVIYKGSKAVWATNTSGR